MHDSPAPLLENAARGAEWAWRDIVDRYSSLVLSVCAQYRVGNADAQDISGAVWLRLVANLTHIREPEALPGWLRTTTRHECLRLLRHQKRQVPTDDPLLGELTEPAVRRRADRGRTPRRRPPRVRPAAGARPGAARTAVLRPAQVLPGDQRDARHPGRLDRPVAGAVPGPGAAHAGDRGAARRRTGDSGGHAFRSSGGPLDTPKPDLVGAQSYSS